MNLQQALLAIGDAQDNELPITGLEVVKENWSEFYPELVRLIDQFIEDDTSPSFPSPCPRPSIEIYIYDYIYICDL